MIGERPLKSISSSDVVVVALLRPMVGQPHIVSYSAGAVTASKPWGCMSIEPQQHKNEHGRRRCLLCFIRNFYLLYFHFRENDDDANSKLWRAEKRVSSQHGSTSSSACIENLNRKKSNCLVCLLFFLALWFEGCNFLCCDLREFTCLSDFEF